MNRVQTIKERHAKCEVDQYNQPAGDFYGEASTIEFIENSHTDTGYLLSKLEQVEEAVSEAKEALDHQYRFNGGIIQNNKAYMTLFNALEQLHKD